MRTVLLAIAAAFTCCLAPASGAAEPIYACQSRTSGQPAPPAESPSRQANRSQTTDAAERRLLEYQAAVARATVLVLDESCAGFVAEAPNLVVTAAHCIPYPKRRVSVRAAAGDTLVARLDRIDRDTDLALLTLAEPLPVVPLVLSERVPAAGDRLMFVGRGDRRNPPQLARVQKLDRCPSLPRVPNAVFTSVAARPGDSGAPLVDASLRVVGLVHGGARCHIAAPVSTLARQLTNDRRTIFAGQARPTLEWLSVVGSAPQSWWSAPRARGESQVFAAFGAASLTADPAELSPNS